MKIDCGSHVFIVNAIGGGADAENIRRRAQEDVSKSHKFAIESFAEALVPVRDCLEMALKVEAPTVEDGLVDAELLGLKIDELSAAATTAPAPAATPAPVPE